MIGIIGYGVIGKVTHEVLFPSENVLIHDIKMDTKISDLFGCDIIFICTPTNNESDILSIKGIIELFNKNSPDTEVVVRSTIIPDSCQINEVINIGSQEELKSMEVVRIIAEVLNIKPDEYKYTSGRRGSAKRRIPDLSTLRKYYPDYNPRDLRSGLIDILL